MAANPPPTPEAPGERLTDEEVAALSTGTIAVTQYEVFLAKEVRAHRAFWARVGACDEAFVREVWCAWTSLAAYGPKCEPDDQDLDDLRPIFPALLAVKAASEAQS